jgi:hypothetical protein
MSLSLYVHLNVSLSKFSVNFDEVWYRISTPKVCVMNFIVIHIDHIYIYTYISYFI